MRLTLLVSAAVIALLLLRARRSPDLCAHEDDCWRDCYTDRLQAEADLWRVLRGVG